MPAQTQNAESQHTVYGVHCGAVLNKYDVYSVVVYLGEFMLLAHFRGRERRAVKFQTRLRNDYQHERQS